MPCGLQGVTVANKYQMWSDLMGIHSIYYLLLVNQMFSVFWGKFHIFIKSDNFP